MATGVPYGDYQLIRKIGAGAMAEVFLARRFGRRGFEKQLVIKRLMPHLSVEERFAKMFVNEARLAALIDHPNLAHVSDFGEVDGTFFLAMEYVEGLTLADFLDCVGRVSPGVTARIGIDLLEALHAIHTARDLEGVPLGLVHRDVSLRNVMIRVDGVVKLLDFGIVLPAQSEITIRRMGTRGFMSPEQLAGNPLDARSDLYSVGVLLHRMVSGEMPPPIALDGVPAELARLVESALAEEREQRPSSAREMQAALEVFASTCGIDATRAHLAELVTSARRVASSPGRKILASIARHTRITRLTRVTGGAAPKKRTRTRTRTLMLWSSVGVLLGAAVAEAVLRKEPEPIDATPLEVTPPPLVKTETVAVERSAAPPPKASPDPPPPEPKKEPPARPRTKKRRGSLAIDTAPWTEVFLEERSLGVTPLVVNNLPAGSHELRLKNPELGIEQRMRVVIRPGQTTRVYRELSR